MALALLLGSCTADGHDAEPQDTDAASALRATPFSGSTVDVLVGVLQDAGVEVVDGVDSPASAPVRVTRWQVENMAAESANGGGVTGRTLAAMAPTPPAAPPTPFLVAAWMLQGATPAARFAHGLYDGEDFGDAYSVRFPDVVLALFLADATAADQSAAREQASGPAVLNVVPVALHVDSIAAPCSAASSFVQRAIEAVADALTVKTTRGGLFTFMAAIWNTAVRLASRFLSGLVQTLTKPLVAQLVAVFNAVAAVEQVSSVLLAWRAPLTPTPQSNRFGVDAEQVTGAVDLQLQPHVLPVPAAVTDCAQSVGVDISASASGSAVTWTTTPQPRPDLATTTSSDPALDTRESAALRYRTGQEPQDALDAPEQVGSLVVSATIRRNDVERLRVLIAQLLLAQVPAYLQSLVESLARPILDAASAKLAELTDVHSQTKVPITYHVVQERCTAERIAAGTYQGSLDTGVRNGAATGHLSGLVTITVTSGQAVTGTLDIETTASAPGLAMPSSSTEHLGISGTTSKPVVTLVTRTIDGKDATFPQRGTTPSMRSQCPAAVTWDLSSLSPGTVATTPKGLVLVARRTG